MAIVVDGVGFPEAFGFETSVSFEEIMGAGPRPLSPLLDIAVPHGVVMDGIDGGVVVAVAFHDGFRDFAPDLTSATAVFAVPLVRAGPMKAAHGFEHSQDIAGVGEDVIVVGQEDPGVDLRCVGEEEVE